MNLKLLRSIKLALTKTAAKPAFNEEEFPPPDTCGWTIREAYHKGRSDGEVYLAKSLLKQLDLLTDPKCSVCGPYAASKYICKYCKHIRRMQAEASKDLPVFSDPADNRTKIDY